MSIDISLYNTGSSVIQFRDMVLKSAKSFKDSNVKVNNEDAENSSALPSVLEESDGEQKVEDQSADDKETQKEINKGQGEPTTSESGKNALLFYEWPLQILRHPNVLYYFLDEDDNIHFELPSQSPTVSMVTNHSNGTLNLWQLTFSDKSKFAQVLSIGHANRISGHRFRVNDITCHPVLPLLLTTSHHNIPEVQDKSPAENQSANYTDNMSNDINGFCSELILWRVDSVGPLSQSGGVSELARINSPALSAFSNVAWIPTLLPSTTLGSLSNSPSACFVASDGNSLCVYQAVIDARTLLAEISSSEQKTRRCNSLLSVSSESSSFNQGPFLEIHNQIKIVSQQSTARPGCIIQLDAIDDATHDWQNTQFLHVFQEQLITGKKIEKSIFTDETHPGLLDAKMEAMVDLQRDFVFEEPFYIVILEKTQAGTTIHMWRLVIASHSANNDDITDSMLYVPDSNLVQDLDESEIGHRDSTAGSFQKFYVT